MKRLKHIINWTIWSLLGLYFLLIILIHVPAVQTFLGRQVAGAVSRKLGTEVSVGRVDLGFFNRLIIDDVVIKDQKHQDMLRSNRMTVKIDLLPLLDGRIRISSAQLFGAHANLYRETAESEPNYQFALDSLKSKDNKKESTLDIRINSLIIRNSSVAYHQLDAPQTPEQFNIKHLGLSDISAYIELHELTKEKLDINIKRLAFKEQSGLQVNRLSMKVEGTNNKADIRGFCLEMPHSNIVFDHLSASYDPDHLKETLAYQLVLEEVKVNPTDFKPLLPLLSHFDHTLTISGTVIGKGTNIEVSRLQATAEDHALSIKGDISLKDSTYALKNAQVFASERLLAEVGDAFPQIPDVVGRLGSVSLDADISKDATGQTTANAEIQTAAGHVLADLTFDKSQHFTGNVKTDGLNLRQLLQSEDLGKVVADLHFSGQADEVSLDGTIPHLEYKDYAYSNIELDGQYSPDAIAGSLQIDDAHIKASIEGAYQKGSRMKARLKGTIQDFAPQALNLSDRWGETTFSGGFDADISGSSFNDIEGTADISNFIMSNVGNDDEPYHLDRLHINSGYDDRGHFMIVSGDMGEARLHGQFNWATLPQSFISYTASKLPTLPGLPSKVKASKNDFQLTLKLTDTDWMQRLLGIPISLNQDLYLNASVNDINNEIEIHGQMPSFTYNDEEYVGGLLEMTTVNDTAHINLELTKLLQKNRFLDLRLKALAGDNTIRSSINIANHDATGYSDDDMRGTLNMVTQLYTNEAGQPEGQVRILPSQMSIRGTEWSMEPSNILYTDGQLTFDHFNLHHGENHLIIDGVASANTTDTLVVDMRNIDVAYVLNLVNFHSVEFGGYASGQAFVNEVFGDFGASADLTVNDFTFQDGPMGTLLANTYWNREEKRIDLHAVTQNEEQEQTHINGYISPTDKDIDLTITAQGTPIEFCQSFTKSFFSGLTGHTFGEVRLAGPLNRIMLTGDLAVQGQTTVGALGTTYQLRGDTIHFEPDAIRFDHFRAYDRNNHIAQVTGTINHRSFKHFTFDFGIDADNVLAYNFPEFDNSTICGVVYATGRADIHGRPGEVVINCDVTPNRNSVFSYNAANPDAISNQQFITWHERDNNDIVPIFLGDNQQASIPSDLRINFRINATPDATLKVLMDAGSGDNITLNGNGVINASFYNKGPFHMFGTYTTERGTYTMTIQNIIKKNFNFQENGTIIFGGNPFDAALNLNAVYTVNGVSLSDLNIGNSFTNNTVRVNCLMKILGTAGAPRVEFDLEMPTVNAEEQQMIRSIINGEQELNQQVVYLLGVGRFYTQGVNNAGTQQYGQTELAMQSLLSGTVSTQINELLSQVIKNDDWNFGANISTGNEGWHNAEYEGLVSGRMLNNRLLINGQFGYRDNATQANPSFIGDFDIRYLLYPNGNLAVKVYNQTNDRYFTRSSLNTQGVGLIMKKDFDGLGDLFHSRRKTKSNAPAEGVQP